MYRSRVRSLPRGSLACCSLPGTSSTDWALVRRWLHAILLQPRQQYQQHTFYCAYFEDDFLHIFKTFKVKQFLSYLFMKMSSANLSECLLYITKMYYAMKIIQVIHIPMKNNDIRYFIILITLKNSAWKPLVSSHLATWIDSNHLASGTDCLQRLIKAAWASQVLGADIAKRNPSSRR